MKYTRLYATEDGASHFADVELEFAEVTHVPLAPPLHLSEMFSATQCSFMKAPAGWKSDWHPSAARNLFVVLSGEWEVTASDGVSQRFTAGDLLLVEDTSGKGHQSRVVSAVESVAVMAQLA